MNYKNVNEKETLERGMAELFKEEEYADHYLKCNPYSKVNNQDYNGKLIHGFFKDNFFVNCEKFTITKNEILKVIKSSGNNTIFLLDIKGPVKRPFCIIY